MSTTDPLAIEMARLYSQEQRSIPEIAKQLNVAKSRVRRRLISQGVRLRPRVEWMELAQPKFGVATRGKRRPPFTPEWKNNIRIGRLRWAERGAKGFGVTSQGYVRFTRGPNYDRMVHVVLVEAMIGRPLRSGEVVHHRDGNKLNNSLENLQLLDHREHARLHREQEARAGKKRVRDSEGKFTSGWEA